ncbi:MAG: HNH endonuclease [Sedimentisphaerales bacterium]|nr:HNH endonuclease [Sedimentisphaerales bacterium]
MSYEGKMLERFNMPTRFKVERALLQTLLKHGGVTKEFGSGQEIVDEIADHFELNEDQRSASLKTIYRKENRVKQSLLWHRLLFRAADSLAKQQLVSRPKQTLKLTKKREWMLTEKGFDKALRISNIPNDTKEFLPTKSYEVQKIVKKLTESHRPENYDPFDRKKKLLKKTKESIIRVRGFRQAIIDAYNYKCAICEMKIYSPDSLLWEVEAAHIVPHSFLGRDDIWNGLALCHLHHWAFDVGWLTLQDDYTICVSSKIHSLPPDFGRFGDYEFIRAISRKRRRIFLPGRIELHPHHNSIRWHRQNVFHQ